MITSVRQSSVIDLSEHRMMADPFDTYARLRANEPLARCRAKRLLAGTGYMVTRYSDVMAIHTDKRFSSDAIKNGPQAAKLVRFAPRVFRLLTDTMVFKDDPDHLRLRSLVNKAFTPKMVARMEADVRAVVQSRIDDMAGRDGVVDLVESLAVPLPLTVISEMLGVRPADRDAFHDMLMRFVEASSSPLQMIRELPTGNRMVKLFERMADDQRRDPDGRLVAALVEANQDGDRLSDVEIVSMIFLLLLAGHDTTANLLGSGVLALLDNPDQLARLREDPDLIDTAVEELLRYTAPVTNGAPRIALEDMEIHGQVVPKGSQIVGMIISANRDETMFEDPERLDLGRSPNRHIAFAFGSHYCLGNQLARLEGRIALRALIERFDRIELAVRRDQLRYKPTASLRGLQSLPLRLN
jgi:cytochrome P450 PksS